MQNSFVLLLSLSRNLYHDLAIYIFAWEIFYCLRSLALNHDFMNRNGILGTAEPPFALVVHKESRNWKDVQKNYDTYLDLLYFEQSHFKNVLILFRKLFGLQHRICKFFRWGSRTSYLNTFSSCKAEFSIMSFILEQLKCLLEQIFGI